MAGLTNNGLETKRLIDVINDLRASAGPIFQDLVPPGDIVDTGDSSTIGRFIGLVSPAYADLWEALQQLYWAFDPNSATGIPHENLVMYGGLTRGQPSPTTAIVLVWGNETTQIGSNAQVRSIDNNFYNVITPITLDRSLCNGFEVSISSAVNGQTYGFNVTSGGSTAVISYTAGPSDTVATITQELLNDVAAYVWLTGSSTDNGNIRVVANDYLDYISFDVLGTLTIVQKIRARMEVANSVSGEIPQDANTITNIATPVLGWDSVNNPDPGVTGKDTETDEELRIRFRDSKFIRAQNISDALYSALRALDGVLSAGVFENETDSYDPVYDLPPHSFRAVVQGGSPTEIAQAIWKNKPLGISSQGNTFSTITDSQGFPRDIYFDRPVSIEIYITMEIETNSATFPADGVERIKANLIDYFQDNFSIGDEVIYSRLYTPINLVPGHQVNSLKIGTSPSPTGTVNIPIPYNGIATLRSSNIIITVV
jgi:hypothetical protein